MRNSLIPLAAILAVALAAAWMLRGAPAIGAAGPDVEPGIFRFAAKERQRTAPMALAAQVGVEGPACPGAAGAAVVLLAGEDRQALTQVALLALAEAITARGGIALLDPAPIQPGEPLPLGAHLRLSVALEEGAAPTAPGAALSARWRIGVTATAPTGLAARWLPDDADRDPPAVLHARLAVAEQRSGATWPTWYAGIGHACARAVLAHLGTPERIADPGARARADAWPAWEGRSEAAARLPLPPGTDDLRWQGAFQFPLVRGWVGAIPVATSSDRTGNPQSALAPLLKRLKRGGWQGQVAADGRSVVIAGDAVQADGTAVDIGAVAWTRDHDGVASELRVAPAGSGWRLELWQVLPGASGVVQLWRTRAAAGDAAAAALLARHRGTVALPADLRAP